MSAAQLPPEVQQRIIDHLHDDLHGLGTCAAVCKDWLAYRNWHHLPRTYMLDVLHNTRNADGFLSLLMSPFCSFLPFVDSVVVWGMSAVAGWTAKCIVPLSRLPNLKQLCLHTAELTPDELPQEIMALLCSSFQKLQSLTLIQCFFTLLSELRPILHSFPQLKVVELNFCVFSGEWLQPHNALEMGPDGSWLPRQITKLTFVGYNSRTIPFILEGASSIRELAFFDAEHWNEFTLPWSDFEAIAALGSTLRSLDVRGMTYVPIDEDLMECSPTRTTSLTSMTFEFRAEGGDEILALFLPSSLQELTLIMSFTDLDISRLEETHDWDFLARCVQTSALPGLRVLRFVVDFFHLQEEDSARDCVAFESFVRSRLEDRQDILLCERASQSDILTTDVSLFLRSPRLGAFP